MSGAQVAPRLPGLSGRHCVVIAGGQKLVLSCQEHTTYSLALSLLLWKTYVKQTDKGIPAVVSWYFRSLDGLTDLRMLRSFHRKQYVNVFENMFLRIYFLISLRVELLIL